MIIDTTVILYRWVNKIILNLPFEQVRVVLNNELSFDGYIIARTTTGIFFKSKEEFRENMMFAEWIPNKCIVNTI